MDDIYKIANGIKNGKIGESFVYCIEEDRFYIYRNGVWEHIFWLELHSVIAKFPEYGMQLQNMSVQRNKQLGEQLKLMVHKRLDKFNVKGYLNFDIGEFDPSTMKMLDHDKENYSTMRVPYPYDYNETCPTWLLTVQEIMQNNQDKIDILQEFFGYCLTRDTTHRKALLLLGESNCGKSTVLNVLRAMVGSNNCSSVPLKSISNQQHTPRLINKLVNIDSDVSGKAEDFEAEFKVITSGEPISCNQKFVETFEFVPYCKMVMAANVFPKITDHSSAFYNRLILIPCERIFKESEMNRNLFKQLEIELPGIFNWSVEGLKRLRERGMFKQNDFMKEAVQELENENNPTNIFFEEHIETDVLSGVFIEKMDLYNKYVNWSKDNGHYVLSRARFGTSVYKKYHKETPKDTKNLVTGKRIWRNLKYVDGTTDQQSNWND